MYESRGGFSFFGEQKLKSRKYSIMFNIKSNFMKLPK